MNARRKAVLSGSKPQAARGSDAAPSRDVALVWGKGDDDGSLNILRQRNDRLEAGVVQPLREGSPIHGEVIQLHAREGSPLCDVEVHVPAPAPRPSRDDSAGPPQVATDAYRKNWEQIYKRTPRRLLN